jgi:tRNA threonylcarbamoyladenosine biosynthesis protein TsaE
LNIASADKMRALGGAIATALASAGSDPIVLAIEGELGAGKTTLVGGVLNGLGIRGPVRSPTYTLVEPYEAAGKHIYHLDLYRLVDPQEVEALAVRDLLAPQAVLLIEWPSKGGSNLPRPDLDFQIHYLPPPAAGRSLSVHPRSAVGHKMLEHIVAAMPE